ncbi:MAG TPA: AAA family ATPase [Alphaproteobacteria bacterium]|nr:AAA family ATPase [Alphaproteobacteria bacterium]
MYEKFYGLTGKPFSLLPDADFLFLSSRHRRAVNLLEYGIVTHAGFIVMTGEVGTGKTTIVRGFLKNAGPDVKVGVITNVSASLGALLGWVATAFEFDDGQRDPVVLYHKFVDFLLAQYAEGRRTVLVIDEAQNMTPSVLEELRMLSNVNNEKDQLLQIMLVGQPELLGVLQRPDLRQFVQRISVHCHLDPLDAGETAAYIRHRLGVVGGAPGLFDDLACAAVHHFTGGVPRLINLLCDQALVYGFSEDRPRIDLETVASVVADRNRGGLSAFQPLADNWTPAGLRLQLQVIVGTMKKPEAA